MSNNSNTNIIEEAYELTEHNKYDYRKVKSLVEINDLDRLREFVVELRQRELQFDNQNDDYNAG